ncbi:MAG: endonuclease [Sphingomonadales bacterium]|nr:endonuclease [Sphingomonadales bacterium]
MKHSKSCAIAIAAALAATSTAYAAAPKPAPMVVRTSANPAAVISSTATIPAEMKLIYLSGGTASPVDPAKPDEFGDTRAQTLSILTKMKATLEGMGLGMGDLIKMNIFMVAPTPGGHMDSAAMNEVFKTFFGTPEQPNKPTRTTVQVAALGRPTTLIEIEAIAAKAP